MLRPLPAFDLPDDGGVEAHPAAHGEVPAVNAAEGDRSRGRRDVLDQPPGGLDRVVGEPQGSGEHIGQPRGDDGERRVRSRQAIGHLVDRPVAAHGRHDLDPVARRFPGQPDGMALAGGLDRFHLELRRQGSRDDLPLIGGHPIGLGVGDQQETTHGSGFFGHVGCPILQAIAQGC